MQTRGARGAIKSRHQNAKAVMLNTKQKGKRKSKKQKQKATNSGNDIQKAQRKAAKSNALKAIPKTQNQRNLKT